MGLDIYHYKIIPHPGEGERTRPNDVGEGT